MKAALRSLGGLLASVLLLSALPIASAQKDYRALYKWKSDYLDNDASFLPDCVAAVKAVPADKATADDASAVNGACALVYSLFDRQTFEGPVDPEDWEPWLQLLLKKKHGEPFLPLLKAMQEKMPTLKRLFKNAKEAGMWFEPEWVRDKIIAYFSPTDLQLRMTYSGLSAHYAPSHASYIALSNKFWKTVNETREGSIPKIPVPEKYHTWTKLDLQLDREKADAMIKRFDAMKSLNETEEVYYAWLGFAYEVCYSADQKMPANRPTALGYYEARPQSIAEAEAWIREDVIPGYKPILLDGLKGFFAFKSKYGKLGADYWAKRDFDLTFNYTFYRCVQDRMDAAFTSATMDSPSFMNLLKTAEEVFDAFRTWYSTPWS